MEVGVKAEIISGLILLLPGFVTAGVIRSLFAGEEENDFDKVVRSLIYSFVDYVVYNIVIWVSLAIKGRKAHLLNIDLAASLPSKPFDVVSLGVISVVVGCIVAFYKTNNGHRWLLARLRITYRTTQQNVWHDTFSEFRQRHVIVNLEDGRRILGWPLLYNDDASQPFLFLSDAEWLEYDENGTENRHPAGEAGILLMPSMKISSIEFLHPTEKPMEPKWKKILYTIKNRLGNLHKNSQP